MKSQKAIKELSVAELKEKVLAMQKDLIKQRGSNAGGAKLAGLLKKAKKQVARMLQELHARGEQING